MKTILRSTITKSIFKNRKKKCYTSVSTIFCTKLCLICHEAKLIQKIKSRRPPGHWFKFTPAEL